MKPDVIFYDNHIVVVYKPFAMPTQPHEGSECSLQEWVQEWIKQKFAKPGKVFAHPVHRLDAVASGIVVFAKTSKALSRLNEFMRGGLFKKTYHALIENGIEEKQGTLENYLVHGDFRAHVVNENTDQAKKAVLHYKILSQKANFTLLEIRLETGRYHQIRAQLAKIGYPIIGDKKYGSKKPYLKKAIALQHVKVTFPHPISEEEMTFTVPDKLLLIKN